MSDTIVFIHGMFQNAKSWDAWLKRFRSAGFNCLAESWPLHEGEPEHLRARPPANLGELRLQTVIEKFERDIRHLHSPPVVIGHSVGGLIVQKLAELGLIHAGVPICSVAPNRMLSFDWKFFSNALQITNPISGNEIFEMTPEAFHQNFANTLSKEDAQSAYLATATHDSRNVLRDCMLETGHIDLKRNNVPLFFIGAEKDHIIPAKLCEKNAAAYEHSPGVAEYRQFPERSHFICGEAGWEEVASSVIDWLEYRVQMPPRTIEANSYIPA